MTIETSAYELASRFSGLAEVPGNDANPQILAMLKLDDSWPQDDEVPWCSAFVNYIAWLLRLPRSKSLRARSWLSVGTAVPFQYASVGGDIIVLKRGGEKQPGPEVIDAPGHVGFFGGWDTDEVIGGGVVPPKHIKRAWVLAGNQGNRVSLSLFDEYRILGVRRLHD
jgi:uncharacterized protein (TIGR02594 family)